MLLFYLLAACGGAPNGQPLVLSVHAGESEHTAILTFQAPKQVATVSYEVLGEEFVSTHTPSKEDGSFRVVIPYLPAGHTVEFEVNVGGIVADASWSVADVPEDFPEVVVKGEWTTPVAITHFAGSGQSFVSVFGAQGAVLWTRSPRDEEGRMLRVKVLPAGLAWAEGHEHREKEIGYIGVQQWEEELPTWTRSPTVHHDFVVREEGFHYLGHERVVVYGVNTVDDVVYFVPTGATEPSEAEIVFRVVSEIDREIICSHAVFDGWMPNALDWTHSNSLVADGNSTWLLVRYFDTLLQLDDQWQVKRRLGSEATGVFHAHFSQVTEDGIALFDNRNHTADEQSRAVFLKWNGDELSAQWQIKAPGEELVGVLGDVKILNNGSVVISWGDKGLIEHYSSDLQWLGSIELPTMAVGRVEVVPNTSNTSSL